MNSFQASRQRHNREYYQEHKEEVKKRRKLWRIKNKKVKKSKKRVVSESSKYYRKNRKRILLYNKKNITQFKFMGKKINVFTNGATEEIKPLIPVIKNKVLKDCIKNPRKYLK